MKLSLSMFDISLPSQHLVFVFDAPKWLLMRPASVPALWNEEMLRRCIEPVDAVVTGIQRALHLVVIVFPARTGVIPLITVDASARHSRRVSAVAAGQTYLPLCARLRGDLYPSAVEAQLSLMQTERRWAGHFLPLRGQRLLTLLATCLLTNFLLAHLGAGKFGEARGNCAFGAINLFLGAREACSWSSWVVQSGLKTDVLIIAVQFWLWSTKNYNITITILQWLFFLHLQPVVRLWKVKMLGILTGFANSYVLPADITACHLKTGGVL